MSTTRPYAYNTGSTISGTTQFGNLAIGITEQDYSANPGGVKWWMGPEETPGTYTIAVDDPGINQSTPTDDSAGVSFWRTSTYTDASFLSAANTIARRKGQSPFASSTDALNWLISSGFPTTYPYEEICDIDTLIYLSGLTTTLSTTQTYLVNKFIVDLKHKLGIRRLSEAFDIMYILAGETEESSLRNLVSRNHDATAVNSPEFNQYEGYSGNGISMNINTNYNPYYDKSAFSLNSCSIGVYVRNNVQNVSQYDTGSDNGGENQLRLGTHTYAINIVSGALNSSFSGAGIAGNTSAGFTMLSRLDSSTMTFYKHGTYANVSSSTTNIPNATVTILSSSNTIYTQRQTSLCFYGKGLTLNEMDLITSTFEEYLDARGKGVIYEPETYTYISGLTTTLSQEQVGYIDTLVRDLKTGLNVSSLSDAFDVMYILAGETEESSLRNLVSRNHDATAVNSPAFTQYEGYSGNGTSSYIRTNWTPYSHGISYELDSCSLGVYQRIEGKGSAYNAGFYSYDNLNVNLTYLGSDTNIEVVKWNINGQNGNYPININGLQGTVIMTFDSDGKKIYKNRSLKSTQSTSNKSSQQITREGYILAWNNNGTVSGLNNSQISFYFVGKRLLQNDINIVTDVFEKYMSSHEKNVTWEDETYTYISGLTTPISYEQVDLINTFIKDVKTGLSITGLTDAFDVMYILAGETSESSLRNLVKREHDATAVNSPTFTQYKGFRSNGTSSYTSTNFNPNTEGINYTSGSSCNFVYVRTNEISEGRFLYGRSGYFTNSAMSEIMIRSTFVQIRNNAFGGYSSPAHNGNVLGMWGTSRIDENGYYYYYNKAGTYRASVSEGIRSGDFLVSYGSGTGYGTNQISFIMSGKYLTSSEVSVLVDAFEKYMDARGYGVIT